jgi:hypothetical protein
MVEVLPVQLSVAHFPVLSGVVQPTSHVAPPLLGPQA